MRQRCLLLVLLVLPSLALAFVRPSGEARPTSQCSRSCYRYCRTQQRRPTFPLNLSCDNIEPTNININCPRTVYVLSYDGTVVNNARDRCSLSLRVALRAWPDLSSYIDATSPTFEQECEWILNKMSALMHAMSSNVNANDGTGGVLTPMVDACLLARLILEEQTLDEGRNIGRGGKYGSKYHPQSTDDVKGTSGRSRGTPVGSRPLTVGEVAANWLHGGQLRDTVRVKYNIDKKDPVPILRDMLVETMSKDKFPTFTAPINEEARQLLMSTRYNGDKVIIVVDQDCRIKEAADVVSSSYSCSIDDLQLDLLSSECTQGADAILSSSQKIAVIAPGEGESELKLLQSIVEGIKQQDSEAGTKMCIIHSSLAVSEKLKVSFGADPPIFKDGYAPIPESSSQLAIYLPTWTDNIDIQQRNDATMDPWLQTIKRADVMAIVEATQLASAWE